MLRLLLFILFQAQNENSANQNGNSLYQCERVQTVMRTVNIKMRTFKILLQNKILILVLTIPILNLKWDRGWMGRLVYCTMGKRFYRHRRNKKKQLRDYIMLGFENKNSFPCFEILKNFQNVSRKH